MRLPTNSWSHSQNCSENWALHDLPSTSVRWHAPFQQFRMDSICGVTYTDAFQFFLCKDTPCAFCLVCSYDIDDRNVRSVGITQCLDAFSSQPELKQAIFLLMAHQSAAECTKICNPKVLGNGPKASGNALPQESFELNFRREPWEVKLT